MTDYAKLAEDLTQSLALANPPLAITFGEEAPAGVEPFADPMPSPTADGRTGRVAAGCVFWMKAAERTFSTVAADHGNCSVGSLTHGFKTLDEAGAKADVGTLVEAGWVTPEVFPDIPVVAEKPGVVTYGPLRETPVAPDVVFLRVNAKQAMTLSDAFPEMRFEGKPQCHIIPIAKERGQVALSVGCMLSRVRTAMPNTEMTCAIPGARLEEVVQRIKTTNAIDNSVADYAGQDARRFDG
ncbi:MAG: DUF169 domain-containing protein [Gammaproteobacteria bacterium]|nr:DUF169 domain-containing protein [Gammaproteobacteria bacterium]